MSGKGEKKVVKITHDEFPLKSIPAQGTITLHYDDGTKDDMMCLTRNDYEQLVKKHGLK